MTDPDPEFTALFEQCQREVRAEIITTQKVIVLRPDLDTDATTRAKSALRIITQALYELECVADEAKLDLDEYDVINDATIRMSFLRPRMRMPKSIIHLMSEMGRAP